MKKINYPLISIIRLIWESKLFMAMRVTLFVIVISMTQVFAAGTYSQNTRLSLNLKNTSIRSVLEQIEDQSEFYFIYNAKAIDIDKKVSMEFENKSIPEILDKLFEGTNIVYKIDKRQIAISTNSVVYSNQKEKSVSGKVTDPSGGPLPGVTVIAKGTTQGTITDSDGNYSLPNVTSNATLVFSFVGMKTQEIAVSGKAMIDVVLEQETIGLDEVVAVGYTTQSKSLVSSAISSVKSGKLMNIPVANPLQAMAGQVAGVRFQQASGAPGSLPYIRIRGNGSLTSSNSPLYVIDGYPTDDAVLFNLVPINDIESIDVLKDAASASIYGSRAGNGVILVTTKSGKLGKTKITFDAITGVEQVAHRYEMAGPELFVEVCKEARLNQGREIPDFLNQPERWTRTDWQDVIFRNAPYQDLQLGASGGNEKMNFTLSMGYLNNQGVIVDSYFKRYSMRASFNAKLNDKLKVGINILPTYSIYREQSTAGGNGTPGVGSILAEALSNIPIIPVWKPNGDYFTLAQDPETGGIFDSSISNPLNKLDANLDYSYALRATGSAFVSFEPIKGLVLKSTINTGFINSRHENYVQAFLASGNGYTGNISTPNLAQISAYRSNTSNINWYWSNTASYDFQIKDKHMVTALLGYDLSRQDDYSLSVTPRTDIDNPIAFINTSIKNVSGAILTSGSSSKNTYVFDAYFARVNYSYDRKYLLSASIRRDRSSRFGPENRAGIFPSVSAAWNISEESFMHSLNYLSTAKLRLSYGETGNDRLSGSYPWLAVLNQNYYNFGTTDERVLTYAANGFSNAQLGWERNKQFDAGMDLGFFKNRINLNVDLYERNSNTIISASIPIINGKASSAIQNIGKIRNRGLEITLGTNNYTGIFKWQTDFNISFNRNKIMKLNGGAKFFGSGTGYIRNYLGRPMADIYAYKIVGTFNNAQDVLNYPKFGTQDIGDLRFEDVSGSDGVPDGKIDANDMTLIGNAQPDFIFGLTNSFQYKKFDLKIMLDCNYGGTIVNQFERAIALNREYENVIKRVAENRWKSESDPGDGKTPKAGTKNLGSNITTNSRYVFDTSFLRIKNISLGYTMPTAILTRIRVQSMRVFFTINNLYTFTNYPGYNPEATTNGDSATSNGYDIGSYPVTRNFSLGINLGF